MSGAVLISIVDDDRPFRESLRRLMRSLGYVAEDFATANDFLASRRVNETRCLIADVHMPAMTGVELYRHLIHTGRRVPTILVTARPTEADRDRALRDGVVGYLGKPLDEEALSQCLRAALDSNRAVANP